MACVTKGSHAADVGTSSADVTPEGVFDLGGNVSEWVADAFVDRYAECTNCKDPVASEPATAPAVIRGGNWGGLIEAARGAGRSRQGRDKMQLNVGFRCARAIER
jgi:formylglycine-generating enzyme required for sulfatase activity